MRTPLTVLDMRTARSMAGEGKGDGHMGGDLAPNLGGTKKFFRGPISEKIFVFRVNISDDLFFSHRPGSSDFPFLFLTFSVCLLC